ncbi:MAG: class I SAM-dependent rRNA methyltransferase [Lachnospiraceae bacterium]|nr:class I SAM-dependent rRNA methyltransferase [Lachnospiraceae bacterium]
MNMAQVFLKKKEGRTIKSGGLWVYDNEIDRIEGDPENGSIVAIRDFDGYFMGYGFINQRSRITVRLMSRREDHPVNELLIEKRVRDAWQYRKDTVDTGCCRVIFGEADFLPGIVIDKFSDVLVVESLALGIDRLKPMILDKLQKVLAEDGIQIRGIYERSDAKVREQEGLPRIKGFIGEEFDTKVAIVENGVHYLVDVQDGQKTGFFLDQKYNRAAIARLCPGKKVLDCFTHTGSFALNAACAGASSVLAVDASDVGIAQAEENARLNHVENIMTCQVADVFDLLPELERQGEQYDVVILDPPAFTKSRASIKNAVKGYREINLRGMKLVKDGGYLATCSCSHFMDPELFAKTIAEAARSAHKRLRQVEFRTQACDHPILWANDTSYYLKFYIFQVVDEV